MTATNSQYFKPGDRVQLHPATDLWMQGARYGTVVRTTSLRVHVKLDVTQRIVKFPGDLLEHINSG